MSAAAARRRLAEYWARERDERMQTALVEARNLHDAVSAVYEETFEDGSREAAHRVIAAALYKHARSAEAASLAAHTAEGQAVASGAIERAIRALHAALKPTP